MNHHRGTADTEKAQKKQKDIAANDLPWLNYLALFSLCLCVSVVQIPLPMSCASNVKHR